MSRKLAEQQGANVGSPTFGVEMPLAAPRRFAGQLVGTVRSIAADLGDRGVHIALALAACIAVLAILGGVDGEVTPLPSFNLMAEVDLGRPLPDAIPVSALFSGFLLLAAAGLAFAASADSQRFPWVAMGAFFTFMGVDEVAGIHERLGYMIASDWQIPYIPIAFLGGVFWLWALRLMWRSQSERLFWLGGASAWILAQMLEGVVLSRGPTWHLIGEFSLVEETLEMAGSSMFLLALYLAWRRLAAGRAELGRHHARA
jgi:hypothetical protein